MAIIAYEREKDVWEVNNCDARILAGEAKELIHNEWGFEPSRIKIIGTPYYEATDWQFIRFDCSHMSWLWTDETIYKVFE